MTCLLDPFRHGPEINRILPPCCLKRAAISVGDAGGSRYRPPNLAVRPQERGLGFDVGDQVSGIDLGHAQGEHVHARVLRRTCKRYGIVLSAT